MRKVLGHQLLWPAVALLVLLVVNVVANPNFFDIRPADPNALMRNLSGGNQQKVLLARWLITQPEILILDEPTRGIDIGAKAPIQKLVAELAGDGMAVVFISAELEEVLRLSDRVAVLKDRHKIAELPRAEASVGQVMELIASGSGAETA